MKIIIIGCGRVGKRIAEQLCSEGHSISIIDRLPLAFDKLCNNGKISMQVGTGIDTHILESAGIAEADAVICVTKGDNTNIMAAQIAQNIYKVPKVVARIVDPKVKHFYENEMGLKCYCQTEVSAGSYISIIKGGEEHCILL